jgi:hypothetical protein
MAQLTKQTSTLQELLAFFRPSESTRTAQSTKTATADSIQSWLNLTEDLQFARTVLGRTQLPVKDADDLRQRIDQIEQRSRDKEFYLAIVGEWNSGKSTFINALLRQPLLATASKPTTAVNTQIRYGKRLDITVTFKAQGRPLSYRQQRAQLLATLSKLMPNLPKEGLTEQRLIALLTAEDHGIADQIERVVINHPADFLRDGIVLIDTLGANAENKEHQPITQAIVENEADAAIILLPELTQASLSFTKFFGELLNPFLQRCIFLVTRMDNLEEEADQQAVIRQVHRRLVNEMQVVAPTIYPTAAKVVLDLATGKPVDSSLHIWQERFVELEKALWQRLQQERTLRIAESMLRLQEKLFNQLSTKLQEQQRIYKNRQVAIRQETIQDLAHFTQVQKLKIEQQLSQALTQSCNTAYQIINDRRVATRNRIHSAIFNTTDESALDQVVKDRMNAIVQENSNTLRQELNAAVRELQHAGDRTQKSFAQEFQSAYQRLQKLAGQAVLLPQLSNSYQLQIAQQGNIAGGAMNYLSERDSEQGGWMVTSLAITGLLVVFTPITWPALIVGGIIGALMGPRLPKQQQSVWEKAAPKIDDYFEQVRGQISSNLRDYKERLRRDVENSVDAHVKQYKSAYDQLIAAQQQEQGRLATLERSVQTDLHEIQRRLTGLQAKQAQLQQKQS